MQYRSLFPLPFAKKELIIGGIALLLTIAIVSGSRWSRLYDGDAISAVEPTQVYLKKTTKLTELSRILYELALIDSMEQFEWAAKIFGWRNFREGHYRVDRDYNYDEFLSKLAKGIQDPVNVTILPGRSKEDIARMVAQNLQFDSTAFHQTFTDSLLLEELNIEPEDVIGRFFPNTYSVFWTTSPEAFFQRIIDEFNKSVANKYHDRIEELNLSLNEIITLASIVEWEAKDKSEKKTISGLYWNRLKKGMRLQSDPTVNYAIGERRRLLYKDYNVDHPYNTYRNSGLPPGPITNPDLKSIEAALFPEDHEYLFMVANPEGSHSFSKTFKEHRQKSAEWRKWIQEQYRIKRMRERGGR